MDKSNLNNLNNLSNTAPSKRSLMSNITNLMIIACIDGQVTEEEKRLIANIAQSYGLSQEEFAECGRRCDECLQKNQLPIDVPESDEAKVGFIRNLVVTMMIDGQISDDERQVIEIIAERFGFKAKEFVDYLIQNIAEEFQKHGGSAPSGSQPQEEMPQQDEEEFRKEIAKRVALGREAMLKNDIPTAFDNLLDAALVDKEACMLFIELLTMEKRFYQITEAQVERMEALAEKGYVVAQYALGRYHQARRPEKDSIDKALALFNNAAEAGLPDAIAARALLMFHGLLKEVDKDLFNQEMQDALEKGSNIAAFFLYRAVVFGLHGYESDPQGVIDNIKKWLGDKESEDPAEVSPIYYQILAMAYDMLDETEKAKEYYLKCIRMGRTDLYSDYIIAAYYDDDFQPIDEGEVMKALEEGIKMGDPYCYVLRADIYEMHYDDSTDEKEKEMLSAKIAEDLKAASALGEGGALVEFGLHSYFGEYGFKEDNETAWNCFVNATDMNMAKAWTMIHEMIENNEMPGERPSSDFLNYCRLMSVRLGDDELLPVLIYNYYKGTMRQYQNEIKKYYLPRYEVLPDEVKTQYFGTQFIAVINTEGVANLVEFDLETEEWDELAEFIDADRLDAIRTEPLANLSEEMGLDGCVTAWVDRNGLNKDLAPNPVGGKLYPGPIVGDMILTLEDEEHRPMSFGDLGELKEIVTALGANLGDVFYNEFPEDDGRNDPHV